ncbi:hypothetical protein ACFS07_15465 [Undibacterium arcticum]
MQACKNRRLARFCRSDELQIGPTIANTIALQRDTEKNSTALDGKVPIRTGILGITENPEGEGDMS